MSGAQSISTRRAYGVQRVCRVWARPRSSVYARRQAPRDCARGHRRGPVGAAPDEVLVGHIRRVLEASPFHGEGYRKVWAKLRGLEVVLPHQPPHPLLRGAPPLNPQLRPHFSVALTMKRRGFEHPTNVGHQDVIRGGADRTAATTRRRGRGRLTPRIHAGAGAVPHAADPLHAIRPTGGDRLGATHRVDLRRANGPLASSWSTFAYSNSVSISSSPILACSRRWSSSRASVARLLRPACPAARN